MNQQADQEGPGTSITPLDTSESGPHTTVDAETLSDQTSSQDSKPTGNQGPALFPVSEGKLLTLYLLSFGLYGVYWFYKNWKLQQPSMDKKIYPLLRAIFSIFFAHSLFKRINEQASKLEKKHRFNANFMATLYVVTIVLSHLGIAAYTLERSLQWDVNAQEFVNDPEANRLLDRARREPWQL